MPNSTSNSTLLKIQGSLPGAFFLIHAIDVLPGQNKYLQQSLAFHPVLYNYSAKRISATAATSLINDF